MLEVTGIALNEADFGDYRYGFNGKENDQEWGKLIQDYGFRLYNPAIAKFLSVDPLAPEYPELTPYQFAGNKPIQAIDLDGLEEWKVVNDNFHYGTLFKATDKNWIKQQGDNVKSVFLLRRAEGDLQISGFGSNKWSNWTKPNTDPFAGDIARGGNRFASSVRGAGGRFLRDSAPYWAIVFSPIVVAELGVFEAGAWLARSRFVNAALDAGTQFGVNIASGGNVYQSFMGINVTSVGLSFAAPNAGFVSTFRNNFVASAYDVKLDPYQSSTLFGNQKSIMDAGFVGGVAVGTKALFSLGIPRFLSKFAQHQDKLIENFNSRLGSGLFDQAGKNAMSKAINKTQSMANRSRLWSNRFNGLLGGASQGVTNNTSGVLFNFSDSKGGLLNFSQIDKK